MISRHNKAQILRFDTMKPKQATRLDHETPTLLCFKGSRHIEVFLGSKNRKYKMKRQLWCVHVKGFFYRCVDSTMASIMSPHYDKVLAYTFILHLDATVTMSLGT